MIKDLDRQYLTTIYLKYGSWAQPLRVIAFSDLTAKTLYASGDPLTHTQISEGVSTVLGIKNVDSSHITKALKHLLELGKVRNTKGKWSLTDEAKQEIEDDINSASTLVKKILSKHFTKKVQIDLLSNWFRHASSEFFGYYSESWLKTVCRGIKQQRYRNKYIHQLLNPSIKKYNLQRFHQELVDGFISFISSEDTSEQSFIMSMVHATFASQLVASDVGVDPIGLEEIRGSTFLLDTNILFALSLEGHSIWPSLNELGSALKALGCKIGYLYITREEYSRALASKKQEVLSLLKSFEDSDIVKDARDDFIITANAKGCTQIEDYEKFFQDISVLPKKFNTGLKVDLIDDDVIVESVQSGEKDTQLQGRVKSYAQTYRPKGRKIPKSQLSAVHDASLIKVVEGERKRSNKMWVLTRDKTLHMLAAHQADPREFPTVISVDALIEILALNGAGPDFDSTKFAPLLTNIVLNQFAPATDTYQTTDLIWFLQVMDKASELPTEDVKQVATEISKARTQGKNIQDTELQVMINRLVQDKIIKRDEKIEQSKALAQKAKDEAFEQKELKEQYRQKAIISRNVEIRSTAFRKFLSKILLRILFSVVIALATYGLSFLLFKWLLDTGMLIDYIVGISSFIISLFYYLKKPWNEYHQTLKDSLKIAENDVDSGISREGKEN